MTPPAAGVAAAKERLSDEDYARRSRAVTLRASRSSRTTRTSASAWARASTCRGEKRVHLVPLSSVDGARRASALRRPGTSMAARHRVAGLRPLRRSHAMGRTLLLYRFGSSLRIAPACKVAGVTLPGFAARFRDVEQRGRPLALARVQGELCPPLLPLLWRRLGDREKHRGSRCQQHEPSQRPGAACVIGPAVRYTSSARADHEMKRDERDSEPDLRPHPGRAHPEAPRGHEQYESGREARKASGDREPRVHPPRQNSPDRRVSQPPGAPQDHSLGEQRADPGEARKNVCGDQCGRVGGASTSSGRRVTSKPAGAVPPVRRGVTILGTGLTVIFNVWLTAGTAEPARSGRAMPALGCENVSTTQRYKRGERQLAYKRRSTVVFALPEPSRCLGAVCAPGRAYVPLIRRCRGYRRGTALAPFSRD